MATGVLALFLTPLPASQPCPPLPLQVFEPAGALSANPDATLDLVTLNLAEQTHLAKVLNGWNKSEAIRGGDVLLLQEVLDSGPDSLFRLLAKHFGFMAVYAPGDSLGGEKTRGVAILSRFQLRDPDRVQLRRYDLQFKLRCRVALAVTAETPLGPVRVVNVHLDSRINRKERIAQLRPVVERLGGFPGPQVIGGDFNTADVLWVGRMLPLPYLQRQSSAIRRFMKSRGFDSPFDATGRTFSYLPLRLDWIFVKGLEAHNAGVEAMPFSDHHALWLRLGPGRHRE